MPAFLRFTCNEREKEQALQLYNEAITRYNNWAEYVYTQLATSKITNQGTATKVQAENISAGDDADI